eukprot:SAG31_NODE_1225_length_9271_cov_10.376472_12_plen_93_part_00
MSTATEASSPELLESHRSLLQTVEMLARDAAAANGVNISSAAINALQTVVAGYVEEFAVDLEHFARHAKRVVVLPGKIEIDCLTRPCPPTAT